MPLSLRGKGVIRLGDTTSHGGKVVSVAHKPTDMGIGGITPAMKLKQAA